MERKERRKIVTGLIRNEWTYSWRAHSSPGVRWLEWRPVDRLHTSGWIQNRSERSSSLVPWSKRSSSSCESPQTVDGLVTCKIKKDKSIENCGLRLIDWLELREIINQSINQSTTWLEPKTIVNQSINQSSDRTIEQCHHTVFAHHS